MGPSEELLHRRQEKEQQEVAARQALRNGRQDVKRLSEQEREQRLQQMQTDADVADRSRARRVGGTSGNGGGDGDRVKNKGIGDDNDRGSSADMSKKNAAFLGDLRTEAYVQSYERGIQERLHQNRHYAQRSVDLNSDGFMRK